MIDKIVSGGQTGVDRAALDIAMSLNIPHGGWCPKGRLAEDGVIDTRYQLKETNSSDYSVRTKQNVIDSDGTLILVAGFPIATHDGTKLTLEEAINERKPYQIFNLSSRESMDVIIDWLTENNIKTLNIAGPRESQSMSIYQKSVGFLTKLINKLHAEKVESPRSRL